jgi:GNAT acetyltransferase-like protein
MAPVLGYAHPRYAESLSEFGQPLRLQHSRGSLLRRRIRGSDAEDAMGCYPLFACGDWEGLSSDLDRLEGLVTVTLVTDPFGDFDVRLLRKVFPDLATPFKEHFVLDLAGARFATISRHHQRYVRASLRKVKIELCQPPSAWIDAWCDLYRDLSTRHGLHGIRAFSRKAFELQLETPGMVAFRAMVADRVVGMHLWFHAGEVCHSHLIACSADGRRLRAAFAMHWTAVEHFTPVARWLNLGGAAGTTTGVDDGLVRFKRGWSSTTRQTFLCGRILDPSKYRALTMDGDGKSAGYFPAYRRGEFA